MKQLATIGVVVLLLLGAALYYSSLQKTGTDPGTTTTVPLVTTPPPKDGNPTTFGTANGTLTMQAAISNGFVLTNTPTDIFAAIDIEAIDQQGTKRPPLNVAVIMDRSGSMAGQKIENAKIAARRLANVLNSGDRISIVSYGSDVTVDFPSQLLTDQNRVRLFAAINNVSYGGGTNLSGGFQEGYSQVSRHRGENTVNRVILMSDGHANVGMTSTPELRRLASTSLKAGISVTTMGVGLDYNEDLMTAMANEGAGNYHFIDQPNTIVKIFEDELKGLASTVARDAVVVIKLAPGVRAETVYGFAHEMAGNQVWIRLSEFYSAQKKNILMKLVAQGGTVGDLPIMDISLSYEDVVNEEPHNAKLVLKSVVTQDPVKAGTDVNVAVIARVQQVEVAESMNEAMKLYEDGKAQAAQDRITRTQNTMQQRRSTYKFKNDAKFGSADKELDNLKMEVNAAPASSSKGKRLRKQKKARSNAIILSDEAF